MNIDYTDQQIERAWTKTRKVDGLDPNIFRLDACGALIMKDKYGQKNRYGWVIDHIYPQILGGKDDEINLRALHYKNEQSKGDDYPSYLSAVYFDGNNNVEVQKKAIVNSKMRAKLRTLYPDA